MMVEYRIGSGWRPRQRRLDEATIHTPTRLAENDYFAVNGGPLDSRQATPPKPKRRRSMTRPLEGMTVVNVVAEEDGFVGRHFPKVAR